MGEGSWGDPPHGCGLRGAGLGRGVLGSPCGLTPCGRGVRSLEPGWQLGPTGVLPAPNPPLSPQGRGPALGTTFPGPSCGASPSSTAPATSSRPSLSHPWRGTPRKASSTCVTPPRAQKAPLPPPPEQRGSRPPTTPAGYVHPCQHLLYAPGHYGALQAW